MAMETAVFLLSVGVAVLALTLAITLFITLFTDKRIRRLVGEFFDDPTGWDADEAAERVKKFFKNSD